MKRKNALKLGQRKGQLQFPFAWLFAIIVGAVILFLAIFAAVRITQTQEVAIDASTAKEIGVLLNPLETGFESASTTTISLPSETRIFNSCEIEGYFGRQIIRLSQRSFGKWTETDINVGFSNKYIFSEEFVEGKSFYLFSKPFNFPFKVSDVIYLIPTKKNYCFIDAPQEISEEIGNLNLENMHFNECPEGSVEVCFEGSCDIKVDVGRKYVEKRNDKMYFHENSLMYAAIFSNPEIYECQFRRLMQRGSQLSQIYLEKANFVSREECSPNLNSELLSLANLENNIDSSRSLNQIVDVAEEAGSKNEIADCKLW